MSSPERGKSFPGKALGKDPIKEGVCGHQWACGGSPVCCWQGQVVARKAWRGGVLKHAGRCQRQSEPRGGSGLETAPSEGLHWADASTSSNPPRCIFMRPCPWTEVPFCLGKAVSLWCSRREEPPRLGRWSSYWKRTQLLSDGDLSLTCQSAKFHPTFFKERHHRTK